MLHLLFISTKPVLSLPAWRRQVEVLNINWALGKLLRVTEHLFIINNLGLSCRSVEAFLNSFAIPSPIKSFAVSDSVKKSLFLRQNLVNHGSEESIVAGLISVCNKRMLIVSRPILRSSGAGPVRGALIFGRYLDKKETDQLAHITHLTLCLFDHDEASLPEDVRQAEKPLLEGDSVYVVALNKKIIAGYSLIKDITGKSVWIVDPESAESYQSGIFPFCGNNLFTERNTW
jgi:hypothetical protein